MIWQRQIFCHGVIHGIDRMLIPKSIQDDFNHWRSSMDMVDILVNLTSLATELGSYKVRGP